MVFDIQRFSVHDGPGIRTVIFLKGCPLSCSWCSNPESQQYEQEIMFNPSLCIECKKCVGACSVKAISYDTVTRIDRDSCVNCKNCVEVCNSRALELAGYEATVEELLKEIAKDKIYYKRSKGGITLSGGEPLYQSDFAINLLNACKSKGWHTALETSGFVSQSSLKEAINFLDLLLFDIKSMDSTKIKEELNVSNQIILDNVQLAARKDVPIIIRKAIIPGFNDNEKDVKSTAKFARWLGKNVKGIDLLPYHRLGENKYRYLGKKYLLEGAKPPSNDKMQTFKKIIEEERVPVTIGGSGGFYLEL
ncbi:glycyl-radical enzyme activating protein [Natranaerofaba carboxydovora]|uniref:glycyl-radical enzyme activating protein n=1 Tax=Natranaerofaba carboxydovora TaxID=2742683 RepID=UPI001F13CB57|nr:glycyl-radical enzyme activating protein [Natranaerofaba carboxydovora]UMZ73450.1 Benzylsuccinate synthase activating enzyme [Natranaerofaba carboxydovora]